MGKQGPPNGVKSSPQGHTAAWRQEHRVWAPGALEAVQGSQKFLWPHVPLRGPFSWTLTPRVLPAPRSCPACLSVSQPVGLRLQGAVPCGPAGTHQAPGPLCSLQDKLPASRRAVISEVKGPSRPSFPPNTGLILGSSGASDQATEVSAVVGFLLSCYQMAGSYSVSQSTHRGSPCA